MRKKTKNYKFNLEEDTIEKLETAAANANATVSEYVSDLIDSSLPQKRVFGKRTRKRQEIIYCEKLNDIINSMGPDQKELQQKLMELRTFGRELLWRD